MFGLASQVVDDETINPNASNNNSFERNMQSTKLISSKGELNNKEQLQNDKKTLNVQDSDLMKFNSKRNVEEREKQEQIFDQQEMSSDELPVFLKEFERSVEQTEFNREVSSEELPLFLSNCTTSSNETSNYKTNDLSNRNVNRNEMTSTELPQCIEFRVNNVFDSNNSCSSEDYANVAQNVVSSAKLPITVLEYNEKYKF